MYHTCLHCTRDLGQNDSVELLPIGRRIAFDAARGRLWVVCRSCGKWNLVPFDNRLEAIDACARLFHDTRTRFSTENIGLARLADGLELVRIGEPERPEFASWRYGAQFKRRRRINLAIGGTGFVAAQVAVHFLDPAMAGSSMLLDVSATTGVLYGVMGTWAYMQELRLRARSTIPGRAGVVKLGVNTAAWAHLAMIDGEPTVSWPTSIIAFMRKKYLTVSGVSARPILRKIIGVANRNVGSAKEIDGAVRRIERGGVEDWLSELPRNAIDFSRIGITDRFMHAGSLATPWLDPPRTIRHQGHHPRSFLLASLPRSDRLAIEMWLSEEDEARALSGELALLERQWREAEELAGIADGLSVEAGEG